MKIRVLIADDHTLVAEGLRYVIEADAGFEVVACAKDGQEALRLAIEKSPDIVLMDNAMPVLNGIEATRLIRERCPQTRVIMLSMYCDEAHVLRALQAGAMGYLLKKSVAKELVEAIRRIHVGQHYLTRELGENVIDQVIRTPSDPLARLSTRERQVLQMVAEGHTSSEIADKLSLSPKTVETYRSRMMDKLGLHDLAALIKFAIQQGVTSIEH
ncbi:MAG TPA: response regulator transcription factor [Burkholderiales bacterium]|nr:response regulator transcription factor [Burkholderiales bacterium]